MSAFCPEFTNEETTAIVKEFQRIKDNTYLDHAGTTLYAETQVEAAAKVLKENLFCNPHTCKLTGDLVDQVRYRILKHFNTDASEYAVVFTANATAALKTVAECFQFERNKNEPVGSFYYCQENHTSVLGMRDMVQTTHQFVLTTDELLQNAEVRANSGRRPGSNNSLVAFSAQCNFSGFKMPLEIIQNIHESGLVGKGTRIQGVPEDDLNAGKEDGSNFYVCLDTASFVATNYLDLQRYRPDFCCVSFYKMFGFPTGVGALIVSKRGQVALEKKYYGGGTVQIAMTRRNFHQKRQGFTERFEDGTLSFLSIASLLEGFRTLDRLIPIVSQTSKMQRICVHVFNLAKYCYDTLANLHHANGAPLIKFYNHTGYKSSYNQGGIVTFNVLHDDGTYVGFAEVACIAAVHNVQLRTGCFCNPGACQYFLQMTDADVLKQFQAGHICSDYNDLIDGIPTGAVRLSFGYMTQLQDVDKAISMIRDCYLTSTTQRLMLLDAKLHLLPKALQNIPHRLRPKIIKICIYPIKSCGAFEINDEWELTNAGFKYDRTWMIVDANGVPVTQKIMPRLCLLKPIIKLDENLLEMSFPGMDNIRLDLEVDETLSQRIQLNICHTKICNDLVEGFDCGNEIAIWLSDCMRMDGLRLLRQCTSERHRRTSSGVNRDVTLVNEAQFLLINQTSVRWLANNIEQEYEPLDHTVDRFRANIIIETAEPLAENMIEEMMIGGVGYKVDGFCTRCQMICINQKTGEKTSEPLRTIARQFGGKIRFGIYLSLKELIKGRSIMKCNDEIRIIKEKS